MIKIEVCVDTPDGIATCNTAGIDRIELCSALGLGGLTPSAGLMRQAGQGAVPAHAMIRPIAGDFVLTDRVLQTMLGDIEAAKQAGLAGIVTGAITGDRKLDVPRLRQLIAAADGLEVTLHRAIDLCADQCDAVSIAVDLGVTRILTSGGATAAVAGRHVIANMVKRAAGQVQIMPGAGVTPANVRQLVIETGVNDVHGSCAITAPEAADLQAFGFAGQTRKLTDAATIAAMRTALNGL